MDNKSASRFLLLVYLYNFETIKITRMKQISTLLSFLLPLTLVAQNTWQVPKENTGLVTKITATWCGPCGGWGWADMEEIIQSHGDDIVISLYAPSSSKLYNADAEEMAGEIGYGGTPNFGGNGINVETSSAQSTAIVDTFHTAPIVANTAYEIESVHNDTVRIKVKTKFFMDIEGEFQLNVFAVENKVIEEQNGQGDSASHKYVHRIRLVDYKDSNNVIVENGASKNDEIVKKYMFVKDPSWKLKDMYIASTLWMVNPDSTEDLLYVNGTKEPQFGELVEGYGAKEGGSGGNGEWPIGVEEVETDDVIIYPNPALDLLNVKQDGASEMTIELTDLLGKVVFHGDFIGNKNAIQVSQFPEGVYMIKVITDKGTHLDRVIIK